MEDEDYQQKLVHNTDKDIEVIQEENKEYLTDAYADFKERLCFEYLIANDCTEFVKLQVKLGIIDGNATPYETDFKRIQSNLCCCLIYPLIQWNIKKVFSVKPNHFAMVIQSHKSGKRTRLYGPGYHILGYYNELIGIYTFGEEDGKSKKSQSKELICSTNGDLIIAKVNQGTIMHFECGGQNIILGPGIHKMTEPMTFRQIVRLDSFYIQIGPEKWVTVPDGYDGIAVNRGMIKVLKGGKQHHLSHAGEVFAKMVPKTIQTDRVPTDIPTYVSNLNKRDNTWTDGFDPAQDLKTTTSEGSAVTLDAMIFWKITDTYLASQTVMEILSVDDSGDMKNQQHAIQAASKNIHTLRQNVLRIAKNHLTALVGSCTLAGKTDSNLQGQLNQDQKGLKAEQKKKYQSGPRMQKREDKIEDKQNVIEMKSKIVNDGQQTPDDMEMDLDDQDIDEKEKMLSNQEDYNIPSEEINFNQMQILQSQQQQNEKDYDYPQEEQVEQQYNQNKNNFQILSVLQNHSDKLKDQINKDFVKIGCLLENICIFKVSPSMDIQKELDKQTKARVDANTALINVLSAKEKGIVEYEISRDMAIEEAKADAKVTSLDAQAQAEACIIEAKGEAESIIVLANSRQLEAQLLEEKEFAKVLAQMRAAGEAGKNIFKGNSNNFVFGNNPGDVIYSLFNKLAKK